MFASANDLYFAKFLISASLSTCANHDYVRDVIASGLPIKASHYVPN